MNFAILSDFGGSNLAVPVRYADEHVPLVWKETFPWPLERRRIACGKGHF